MIIKMLKIALKALSKGKIKVTTHVWYSPEVALPKRGTPLLIELEHGFLIYGHYDAEQNTFYDAIKWDIILKERIKFWSLI